MIEIQSSSDGYKALVVWTEPPSIYLDAWALTKLAKEIVYQTRFLDLFKDRGTLLFSLMNVVEISKHAAPQWPELRSFLEKIGPHCFPLTTDPFAVISKQEAGNNPPDASVSSEFLRAFCEAAGEWGSLAGPRG